MALNCAPEKRVARILSQFDVNQKNIRLIQGF